MIYSKHERDFMEFADYSFITKERAKEAIKIIRHISYILASSNETVCIYAKSCIYPLSKGVEFFEASLMHMITMQIKFGRI